MKFVFLFIYYAIAQYIPMQPMPGYRFGYALRRFLCRYLLKKCGSNVIVKDRCYFGRGNRLTVGDRSQLGQNARLGGAISIGDDCLMGPDVVMMATSHEYGRLDIPINLQGESQEQEIVIGNDVWIGTRVIILPGCRIGNQCIIAAGAVVTRSFPDKCIIGGVPARILKERS